jgi:hypothetical protein
MHTAIHARAAALALSLTGSMLLVGCNAPVSEAPAKAPAQTAAAPAPWGPPVSINAEMVALVDHASHELWNAEAEGKAPKTDDDWTSIEEHATQLAAAGSLIARAGTGVNDTVLTQAPGWQQWSHALSDAAMAARQAAQSKNLPALITANGQLVDTCEGCHKDFKPSLPSEGIMHHHVH